MANTIIGKVLSTGKTVNVSKEKEFLKRELVLDSSRYDTFTGEKKENYVTLTFQQKNCAKLDNFEVGQLVKVSFVLFGRKYEKDGQTKYITDIVGYDVELAGSQASPVEATSAAAPSPAEEQQNTDEGDLPF